MRPHLPPSSPGSSASDRLDQRAKCVLVGGVNSPVRCFSAVGERPRLVKSAHGAWITDVDGRRYIDLMGSWGTAIVGHSHPEVTGAVADAAASGLSFGATCEAEIALAELVVSALPSCELIRCVNSGTEAVMSAVRLARAATGRAKVLKFDGCYHGHSDGLLVRAGSGAAGIPASAGLPPELTALTVTAPYNDADAARSVMEQHGREIAAVLIEPAAGNMGLVPPMDGYLQALRALCDEHGSLLIFDEVMTGFRVAWGGFQNTADANGARPDVTCLGKVIGGGMPVAAYAARAELMELVSPVGPVYQAGTLSGNPVAMAAGLTTLQLCRHQGFYAELTKKSAALANGFGELARRHGIAAQTCAIGGMLGLFFADRPVCNFGDAMAADQEQFKRFFRAMIERGVWLPPSPFEAMFVSAAHGDEEIEQVLSAAAESFAEVAR